MAEKKLATEYPDPNESKLISEMTDIIIQSLAKDYGKLPYLRRFHAKSTGLARGRLLIHEHLPSELQQGIFEAARSFDCYVRFSNGAAKQNHDREPGVRGMAIKILDNETPEKTHKIAGKQDFLLTNNPTLFPGTLKMQHAAIFSLFKNWRHFLPLLSPFRLWGLSRFLLSQAAPDRSLNLTYYSGTPYLFGEANAVKWVCTPLQLSESTSNGGYHYLQENLREHLLKEAFYFNFSIQLQEDPILQPIEDSSVRWRVPLRSVATLVLDKQDINSPELRARDEQIHFNPWNCVPEHRPLGGPNRFRKEYTKLMLIRQLHNKHYFPSTQGEHIYKA